MNKIIAIYCRTALKNEAQMREQQNCLLRYTKKNDLSDIKIYSDNGYSCLGYRPAFTKLLDDIKSGNIDMIITKDISRITRDISGMISVIDLLESNNVKLIALDEAITDPLPDKEKSKIESIITTQNLAFSGEPIRINYEIL